MISQEIWCVILERMTMNSDITYIAEIYKVYSFYYRTNQREQRD